MHPLLSLLKRPAVLSSAAFLSLFRFPSYLEAVGWNGINVNRLIFVVEKFNFDVVVRVFQHNYALGSSR